MTDPKWYYEKDNQAWGPLYEDEIHILIREGSITADTLLWTEPMEEWSPASSIDKFRHFFVQSPPPLPSSMQLVPLPPEQKSFRAPHPPEQMQFRTQMPGDSPTRAIYPFPYPVIPVIDGVSQVQPWNRFMAKMVDYSILLIVLYVLQTVFFTSQSDSNIVGALFDLIAWTLAGFFLVFIEPAFISRYGKTPGKHIFGISVRHRDGSLLSYAEARTRTYNAWVNGLGFNVIIVSWITMFYQYDRLIRKGITSWDRSGDYVTTHKNYDFVITYIIYTIFICYLTYEILDAYFTEFGD